MESESRAERRCGCSASILTERAPSSRAWDYPAAADPSPRPAPPNRRGSPGTKVERGWGRAEGAGSCTVPATHKFVPRSVGVLGGFESTCGRLWFFYCGPFFEGGSSFEVKKKFSTRGWL